MTEHVDGAGRRPDAPDSDLRVAGTIPVLRLDSAQRADGAFDQAFLTELRAALHEIGFLQLTGYGAAPGQVGALTAAAARFFALPLEERLRLDNRLSPHFRGYTRLGHEITAGRPDAREQIDFAPEQAPVPRELWDAPYRLLEGPNQWPDDTVPELRPLVEQWTGLLSAVGRELTRAVAAALALPEDHFDQYFAGQPHWFGKLIRYVGATDGTDQQGVGPHTDWNFLTLLLQDGTGGLQALPAGTGRWIDVPPLDGALVVNIGEMLEVATHGYLVATPTGSCPARRDGRGTRSASSGLPGWTRPSIRCHCRANTPSRPPESASPGTTSCTAASATTRSRAGSARTPRSQRSTMPTCSTSRTRATDHRKAVPASPLVDASPVGLDQRRTSRTPRPSSSASGKMVRSTSRCAGRLPSMHYLRVIK
jgi:isopenicillin N synthase-like dioxygenase